MLRILFAAVACSTVCWSWAVTLHAAEYLAAGAKIEKVFADGRFTEGPAIDKDGHLYFSDSPNDRIMRRSTDGVVSVFRAPCGRANGLDFDAQGRLVMCQSMGAGGGRRLARLEADGRETVLAETYEGKRFSAPNDLAIDPRGPIYFTDMPPLKSETPPELPAGVYRVDAPGRVVRVIDNLARPNGLALSADRRLLYVSDRGTQKVHRYRVADDGSLTADGILYDFSPDRGVDGMCLDTAGNMVAAAGQDATTGLFVVSPAGKLIGHQPIGEFATNVCFGGSDLRDLYLTAGKSVYHLRTTIPGLPPVCWTNPPASK